MRTRKHTHRIISRVRRAWGEMSYANRRAFELRTGMRASAPNSRARARREIEILNALYDAD